MRALSPYNALRRHNEASRRSRPRGALVATILKVRRNATEQDKLLHPRVSFCHGCDSSRRRVASTPRGLVDAQEPHCVLQSAAARFENWMVTLEPVWARIADCLRRCEFEAGRGLLSCHVFMSRLAEEHRVSEDGRNGRFRNRPVRTGVAGARRQAECFGHRRRACRCSRVVGVDIVNLEKVPDTVMCDAEGDGLEGDRSPMDSATYASHPVDDFSD